MVVNEVVPNFRGSSHKYAFYASIPAGLALVFLAPTPVAASAAMIYALVLWGVLGISALYHRRVWSVPAARRMRRLDHSMIFIFIAGTFTPFPMLVLDPSVGTPLLWAMWGTAVAGLVFKQVWLDAPNWLGATLYVTAGCVAAPYASELIDGIGTAGISLLGAGGVFFIVGAVVYALRRPNPWPSTFGYHEVFHVLVLAGIFLHFIAVAGYAIQVV